jgi:hypothetical protein
MVGMISVTRPDRLGLGDLLRGRGPSRTEMGSGDSSCRCRGGCHSGHWPAHDLPGGPRSHLSCVVAGVGGALVLVERQPAEGIEVARHAGSDLRGGRDATGRSRRRRQTRAPGAEGPEAGEPGVREGDDTDGVAPTGILGIRALLTDPDGGGLQAPQANVAVRGAQDVLGLEVEVVHAAVAGGLQRRRDLTGDAAHLVTGHPALVDQLGEVAGVLEVLLHDVGDVVVVPDVEDPHEDRMAERPGAASGVEQGGGAVVVDADAQHRDASPEGRVIG